MNVICVELPCLPAMPIRGRSVRADSCLSVRADCVNCYVGHGLIN